MTPNPSRTPLPTPASLPTKTILVIYRESNQGDGVYLYADFLENPLTEVVLYTDGQAVRGNSQGWSEAWLTPVEMCDLLGQIAATGLLELDGGDGDWSEEDTHAFDETTQYSDGAPADYFIINGNPPIIIRLYLPYKPYLRPEVSAAITVFRDYPTHDRQRYQPQRLWVWVEPGWGELFEWVSWPDYLTPNPTPETDSWPDDLPPLASLVAGDDYWPALIQGPQVTAFEGLPKSLGVYRDEGLDYFVIVRRLLPHEPPTWYGYSGSRDTPFELPFSCPAWR